MDLWIIWTSRDIFLCVLQWCNNLGSVFSCRAETKSNIQIFVIMTFRKIQCLVFLPRVRWQQSIFASCLYNKYETTATRQFSTKTRKLWNGLRTNFIVTAANKVEGGYIVTCAILRDFHQRNSKSCEGVCKKFAMWFWFDPRATE